MPAATRNSRLSSPERDVWLIEALDCTVGDVFQMTFEEADPRRRQGLWIGVHGQLRVAEKQAPQFTLWEDVGPASVSVRIVETDDGLLRFYNVWDSGQGRGRQSQRPTSGMVRQDGEDGVFRYRCSDFGPDPTFDALVFSVRRV